MAFIYFATQIDKCREKVWKKGVEFRLRRRLRRDKLRRGKRTDPAKGLFPLLKSRAISGTEQKKLQKKLEKKCLQCILPDDEKMGKLPV